MNRNDKFFSYALQAVCGIAGMLFIFLPSIYESASTGDGPMLIAISFIIGEIRHIRSK